MKVYRVGLTKHAQSLYASGVAALWNSEGQRVIYTASSIALACLENVVRRSGASLEKGDFSITEIIIDDKVSSAEFSLEEALRVSADWSDVSRYSDLQKVGDDWLLSGRSCLLKVPSAIVPLETNVLINPAHIDYKDNVTIGRVVPFRFDPRIKLDL